MHQIGPELRQCGVERFDLAGQLGALADNGDRNLDLAKVRDIGQCLQIRDLGVAARVYAEKHKMAQDAQDACQRIVAMAEKRIGLELAAAQQRGELARADGSTHHRRKEGVESGDTLPPTYAEIGITRQQAHEFKQMATLADIGIYGLLARALSDRASGNETEG